MGIVSPKTLESQRRELAHRLGRRIQRQVAVAVLDGGRYDRTQLLWRMRLVKKRPSVANEALELALTFWCEQGIKLGAV